MKNISRNIGIIATSALMSIAPLTASASTSASSSSEVWFSSHGIVRAIGATVTSVGNNVITAATTIGNIVLTWNLNVSNDTHLKVHGLAATGTDSIAAGDKIGFAGTLTGAGQGVFTLLTSRIVDTGSTTPRTHHKEHADKSHTADASTTAEISSGRDANEHEDIFGLGVHAEIER